MPLGWSSGGGFAAALLVTAVLLLIGPRGRWAPRRGSAPLWSAPSVRIVLASSGAALSMLVVLLPARRTLLCCILAGWAAGVLALARRGRLAARAAKRRDEVVAYTEALVGELRAGLPVGAALGRCVEVWAESAPVASAARLGADVPRAFNELARLPGAESLRQLGAVWTLCSRSGAGLSQGVLRVLETARSEQKVRRLVQAELGSARATARMVGVMPLLVLVAGEGIGAHPWRFLFDTLPGLVVLAAGLSWGLAGLWWVDRIAAAAVRPAR